MYSPRRKMIILLYIFLFNRTLDAYAQQDASSKYLIPYQSVLSVSSQNHIHLIDSISKQPGITSPFCEAYSNSMLKISSRLEGLSQAEIHFIDKFLNRFALKFIESWKAWLDQKIPASSNWNFFYKQQEAKPWQLVLLGVNAHINGDMWQALTDIFSPEELKENKNLFLSVQQTLDEVYQSFFKSLEEQEHFFKLINWLTLRIPEKFGCGLVYKWRKRQLKLAILQNSDPARFSRLLQKIRSKKQHIDLLIMNH